MTLEDYLLAQVPAAPIKGEPRPVNEGQVMVEPMASKGLASTAGMPPQKNPAIINASADIGYGNVYSKVDAPMALDSYFNRRGNQPLQAVTVGANLSKKVGPVTVGVRGNTQLGTGNNVVGYNVKTSNGELSYDGQVVRVAGAPSQQKNKLGFEARGLGGINGLALAMAKESSQYNGRPKEVKEHVGLRYSPANALTFFVDKNKSKVDNEVVNSANKVGAEYRVNDNGTITLARSADDSVNGGRPQMSLSSSYKF